ncbi:hypothetical protein [Paenibacillus sp. MMS20-IR301]|nr:hypothetical protein [Paenibacillus sp. MMS20-IR301]WNS44186.1 hypothetical protein LOS79_02650 [Paenibacillus sp. MMS20-IR301]
MEIVIEIVITIEMEMETGRSFPVSFFAAQAVDDGLNTEIER